MLELALAGTPSCGKSTFFKAATLKDVKIAPYPFTTTESTEGTAHVSMPCPCKEKSKITSAAGASNSLCGKCADGTRFVAFKLWDIPGLVANAHAGRGKGIAFLDDIMQCQGLVHLVDCSGKTDLEGNPAEGFYPGEAIHMLETEFDWWLLGIFKRAISAAGKGSNEPFLKVMTKQFSGLRIKEKDLKDALAGSGLAEAHYKRWTDEELIKFVDYLRKVSKPTLIVANKMDAPGAEKNLESLGKDFPNATIVPASGDFELALREAAKAGLIRYVPGASSFEIKDDSRLSERQKSALKAISSFLAQHKSTGVQRAMNACVYGLLKMIVVFPVADASKWADGKGNVLPDAFLIKSGSTARDLAFEIHKEIGERFISAVNARTGLPISSDQALKHGDIISIKAGR
jgi:hypothetical protein